jgi:hypothetical protein
VNGFPKATANSFKNLPKTVLHNFGNVFMTAQVAFGKISRNEKMSSIGTVLKTIFKCQHVGKEYKEP